MQRTERLDIFFRFSSLLSPLPRRGIFYKAGLYIAAGLPYNVIMNNKNAFKGVAATPDNPRWRDFTARQSELYSREDEIRSPFARDYTRILHCTAFRRLKHKTQVFYNVDNDHVCTRLEHVAHVESVANTIAKYLGLNDELTRAISFGHDLGHAPFGHYGERVLSDISKANNLGIFWHERNGLRLVDKLELLEDSNKKLRNLNLTYAVRDGIISHCGEVDQNGIRPRGELIELEEFDSVGKYQPATWEGCVVKISDKIAYIGRDIEDALSLGFLTRGQLSELEEVSGAVNTTVIVHDLISDICKNSSPEKGICLSNEAAQKLNAVKAFNYKNIYSNSRFKAYQDYAKLVLNGMFEFLMSFYAPGYAAANVHKAAKEYPLLCSSFSGWLAKLCLPSAVPEELKGEAERSLGEKIYGNLSDGQTYAQAVVDFLSCMTDKYAVRAHAELLSY